MSTDRTPETSQDTNPMPGSPPLRRLSSEDAAALEVLLRQRGVAEQSGPRLAADDEAADPRRVAQLQALLATLEPDADETVPNDLAHRTLRRIAAQRPVQLVSITPADALMIDAVFAAHAADADTTPIPAGTSQRYEHVKQVVALLEMAGPSGDAEAVPPGGLAQRTLDEITAARQRERFAAQIDMFREAPRGIGVSLRQIATAAAVFLLGVSLLLPMLSKNRAEANRAACASNLGAIGMAFGQYAADHAGVLPRGKSVPGSPWWNVGAPNAVLPDGTVLSNSAHLYMLVRVNGGYIDPAALACRTNEYAPPSGQLTVHQLDWSTPLAVSYSYQNQFTPEPLRLDTARNDLAVLADKNPLFAVLDNGRVGFAEDTPVNAPSRLHRGDGQNVLTLDGSAGWTLRPRVDDDNFWTLRTKDADYRYRGNETPDRVGHDAFLVP